MKRFLFVLAIILSASCSYHQENQDIDPLVGMWHFASIVCYEDGERVEHMRSESEYILFEEDQTGFMDSTPILWERDHMFLKITDQMTDEFSWCEIKALNETTLILYYISELENYTWERFMTYKKIK